MSKFNVGDTIEFESIATTYHGVVEKIEPCREGRCVDVLLQGRSEYLHVNYWDASVVRTNTFETGDRVAIKGLDKRIPLAFYIKEVIDLPDITNGPVYKLRMPVFFSTELGWWKAEELEQAKDGENGE